MKPQWIIFSIFICGLILFAIVDRLPGRTPNDEVLGMLAAADSAAERLEVALSERSKMGGNESDQILESKIASAYNEAVRNYRAAYEIEPSASVLIKLGYVYLAIGDIAQARYSFVEALTKWPRTAGAYAGLGDALFEFGDYRGAIENYQTALWWQANGTSDPGIDAVAVHLSLAQAFATLHLSGQAIKEYESVLSSQPDDINALAGLFHVYIERKNWEGALAILDKIHSLVPEGALVGELLEDLATAGADIELPKWADTLLDQQPHLSP